MSKKRFLDKGSTLYVRVPSRGPNKGRPVYFGRVWIKSEKKSRHFRLGIVLEEARTRLHKILADPEAAIEDRRAGPPPLAYVPLPMSALIDTFVKSYHSAEGSEHYHSITKSWRQHFGTADAKALTAADIEDYRDRLLAGGVGNWKEAYSESTVRKNVGALGTMFRWAIRHGHVATNPADGVKRPTEPRCIPTVLSHDEEARLLAAADWPTRLIIRLFLASGMRQGGRGAGEEGLNLKWAQVDTAGGAILINRSKTGQRGRAIPLNDRLRAVLADAVPQGKQSVYVLSDARGEKLNHWIVRRSIAAAMRGGGIEKRGGTFLLMRHTFGSRLAEAGVSMIGISTIMGNSVAVCERHYIRLSPGHLTDAMARLDGPASCPRVVREAPPVAATAAPKRSQLVKV